MTSRPPLLLLLLLLWPLQDEQRRGAEAGVSLGLCASRADELQGTLAGWQNHYISLSTLLVKRTTLSPAMTSEISYVDVPTAAGDPSDDARIDAVRSAYLSKLAHGNKLAAHLKGFTSGLLTDDLDIIGHAIVKLLRERKVEVVCWDGDDFAENSFTKVLTHIKQSMTHVQFVAFLRSDELDNRYKNKDGFNGSWQPTNLAGSLTVLLCDNKIGSHNRYEHLGVIGLKATRATLVIAVGGGATLRKEYDQMLGQTEADTDTTLVPRQPDGQMIEYALFDAVRARDGLEEHAAIFGLPGVLLCPMNGLSNKETGRRSGMLTVAIKVMKIIGIDEKAQTIDLILFVRMEWDMPDGEPPWIEWRDWCAPQLRPPAPPQSSAPSLKMHQSSL